MSTQTQAKIASFPHQMPQPIQMTVVIQLFCRILPDGNNNVHSCTSSTEKDLIYEQERGCLFRSSGYGKALYGSQL